MSPNSDSIDINGASLLQGANARANLLKNMQIYSQFVPNVNKRAQYFNTNTSSNVSSSDQSTTLSSIASSDEYSSKKKSTVHFNFPSTNPLGLGHKKYSMFYVSKEETQKLIVAYERILPKVQLRQELAASFLSQNPKPKKRPLISVAPTIEEVTKDEWTFEGEVARKRAYKPGKKQASKREWRNLYAVLKGNKLYFYKDPTYRLHNWPYHQEKPLIIDGGCMISETSSRKRKYLIRIRLSDNSEYMLSVQSVYEWAQWLAELNTTVKRQNVGTTMSRSSTLSSSSPLIKSPFSTAPSTPAMSKAPISILTIKDPKTNGDLTNSTSTGGQSSIPPSNTLVLSGVLEQPFGHINSLSNNILNIQISSPNHEVNNNNPDFSIHIENQDAEDSYL